MNEMYGMDTYKGEGKGGIEEGERKRKEGRGRKEVEGLKREEGRAWKDEERGELKGPENRLCYGKKEGV